ncbi:MAG: hypothetical protein E7252_03515 [Lachnospira sp.]|nr:hypothetical protein [Lachnospira sp.]
MKRKISIFIMLCVMLCAFSACNKEDKKPKENNVLPSEQQTSEQTGDVNNEDTSLETLNLISEVTVTYRDYGSYTYKYEYNSQGKLIRAIMEQEDKDEKLVSIYELKPEITDINIFEGDINAILKQMIGMQYDKNGELVDYNIFKFERDEYDNPLSYFECKADGTVEYESVKYEYEYDAKGNTTKVLAYEENVLVYVQEYEYDDNGNCTCQKFCDADKQLDSMRITTYNVNGDILEIIDYDSNEVVTARAVYTYNDKGKETSYILYNMEGKVSKRTESAYDESGNLINYKQYGTTDLVDKEERYTYDANNNMREKTQHDMYGQELLKEVYEYDSYDNQTALTRYVEDREVYKETIEYTYDANGNMLTSRKDNSGIEEFAKYKTIVVAKEETEKLYNLPTKKVFYKGDENIGYSKNHYDVEGRLILSVEYNKEDEVKRSFVYSYNIDGTVKSCDEINFTDEKVYIRNCTLEYDSNGRKTKCSIFDTNNTVLESYEYQYDTNGKPIGEIHYAIDASKIADIKYEEMFEIKVNK